MGDEFIPPPQEINTNQLVDLLTDLQEQELDDTSSEVSISLLDTSSQRMRLEMEFREELDEPASLSDRGPDGKLGTPVTNDTNTNTVGSLMDVGETSKLETQMEISQTTCIGSVGSVMEFGETYPIVVRAMEDHLTTIGTHVVLTIIFSLE